MDSKSESSSRSSVRESPCRMTTPDLGDPMTDFSHTVQHFADGRAAAQAVVEELLLAQQTQVEQTVAPRPSSIRIWDRLHRAA